MKCGASGYIEDLNILSGTAEKSSVEVVVSATGCRDTPPAKPCLPFIRYLLGEPNYGTGALMEAVARKFDELWVLGEVMVEKQLWLVARPMHLDCTGSRSRVALLTIIWPKNQRWLILRMSPRRAGSRPLRCGFEGAR